jgi:hypothetical protein
MQHAEVRALIRKRKISVAAPQGGEILSSVST